MSTTSVCQFFTFFFQLIASLFLCNLFVLGHLMLKKLLNLVILQRSRRVVESGHFRLDSDIQLQVLSVVA